MKKIFTLALALMGFASVSNAASVDDIAVCKHSYVLVCDDWNNGNTESIAKGSVYGDGFFFTPTGHSVAGFNADGSPKKGAVDLSQVDALGEDGAPLYVTQDIVDKYGEYGLHNNSLRLKNSQDVLAMKVTAKSKLIFFLQGNNKEGKEARIPKLSKKADLSDPLNPAPDETHPKTLSGFKFEYTVDDDMTLYIGSYNGDMFVSYIIVEANEAPGTPTVKVGDQTYADGLWFREVTCKANKMEGFNTLVTYTTDGSAPTAASTLYTAPIKCYQNMTVKFQAFMDLGTGKAEEGAEGPGADNEGIVNFMFDAPTIEADGANIKIVSPYEGQGAVNFYKIGDNVYEDNTATLTEATTVTAYTKIENGNYGSFTSNSTTKDVYEGLLAPVTEKKTITVSGTAVVDEEATAAATDGSTAYKIEDGAITADKKDFFVKNLTISPLASADVNKAKYQVPEGQEAYIQMSNTNITFFLSAGYKANVKVVCSKNSCKTIDLTDDDIAADSKKENDRKCFINVNGTNYGGEDLTLNPDGNVVEFELVAEKVTTEKVLDAEGNPVLDEEGKETTQEVHTPTDSYFTFQKYSGTGNVFISSIEITPEADAAGIKNLDTENAPVKAVRYNVAGQKVGANYKGLVIENGKKFVVK